MKGELGRGPVRLRPVLGFLLTVACGHWAEGEGGNLSRTPLQMPGGGGMWGTQTGGAFPGAAGTESHRLGGSDSRNAFARSGGQQPELEVWAGRRSV